MLPSLNIAVVSISMMTLLIGFACESQAQSAAPSSLAGQRNAAVIGDNGISADPRASILPMISGGSDHLIPGALPGLRPENSLPKVFAPTKPRDTYTRYPWKRNIVTTVFWIGETPTRNNPTPNTVSAWDRRWTSNFGGFDDPSPSAREGYIPKKFTPQQNPFYYALPYNDVTRTGTKASARAMIPWFKKRYYRAGRTVLKGQWMAIRRGDQICYAQWEDVGPFETDDYNYIFGDQRPKTKKNRGAGLDVSPAIRDYLGFGGGYGTVDWRFVDLDEVPDGPWKKWGTNNPFANSSLTSNATENSSESILKVRELRDRLVVSAKKISETTESIE